LNTDGAIDQVSGIAGAGFVAKDSSGSFMYVECRKYDGTDPFLAELLACRDAIQKANELKADRSVWRQIIRL
jgi:ribonuclease HI